MQRSIFKPFGLVSHIIMKLRRVASPFFNYSFAGHLWARGKRCGRWSQRTKKVTTEQELLACLCFAHSALNQKVHLLGRCCNVLPAAPMRLLQNEDCCTEVLLVHLAFQYNRTRMHWHLWYQWFFFCFLLSLLSITAQIKEKYHLCQLGNTLKGDVLTQSDWGTQSRWTSEVVNWK